MTCEPDCCLLPAGAGGLSQVNPVLLSPGKQNWEQNGDIFHPSLGVQSLAVIRQMISMVIISPKKGVERQSFLSVSEG